MLSGSVEDESEMETPKPKRKSVAITATSAGDVGSDAATTNG